MLLPFLISRTLQPIWVNAEGPAMLRIYAAAVGVLVSLALALRFLVLV
jgi:hypothetical protein